MKRVLVFIFVTIFLFAVSCREASKPETTKGNHKVNTSKEKKGQMKISGKFEVDLKPIDSYTEGTDGIKLGRMSIDKTFSGELSATSKGEMLSAMTPVKGSAGYVAIEQVTGTLSGKSGGFVLQHFGTMSDGHNNLQLEVVPDSGTGELTGISGKMTIRVEDEGHFYDFSYQIN